MKSTFAFFYFAEVIEAVLQRGTALTVCGCRAIHQEQIVVQTDDTKKAAKRAAMARAKTTRLAEKHTAVYVLKKDRF